MENYLVTRNKELRVSTEACKYFDTIISKYNNKIQTDTEVSNEDLLHYLRMGLNRIGHSIDKLGDVFFHFANRNTEDVNIYLRDLEESKKTIENVLRRDEEAFAYIQDMDCPYIEGVKVPLKELCDKLAKLNVNMDARMEEAMNFIQRMAIMFATSNEFRSSDKPLREAEFPKCQKLEKDFKDFFNDVMDVNQRTDHFLVKNIVKSSKEVKDCIEILSKANNFTALKHIRKIQEMNKDIADKITMFSEDIRESGAKLSSNRLKYLTSVIECGASIVSYYGGMVTLIQDAAKTIHSLSLIYKASK